MARLPKGEHEERTQMIFRLLQRHRFGLKESEIAEETDLHRRVVNNYLRKLRKECKVYKDGRYWFSE